MYFRYQTRRADGRTRYSAPQSTSLFGCNSGAIPRMLTSGLAGPVPSEASWKWHLPVESGLCTEAEALIIDLKPRDRESGRPSLYELRDVWGYSNDGWTPIMLRLRALCIDGEPHIGDWQNFEVSVDNDEPIYTFLFLNGAVKDGRLDGRWTATSPSPTNSLLLFPHLMRHFIGIVTENDPALLK